MTLISTFKLLGALATSLALSACASSTTIVDKPNPSFASATTDDDLSCKQLTGRMQVRLLEYRDFANQSKTTSLSRGLQTAVSSVFGGTTAEADPDGQYAATRRQLEDYNKRLAAKDCKTFDIDRELNSGIDSPTPTAKKPAQQ